MTDPAGIEWTWKYDSLGLLREEWDPDAGHRTTTYDKAGRPQTQTDAMGQTTTLSYKPLVSRLETRTNASGTVTYTYSQARVGSHNVGRLTQVTSPADTLEMDYDALGRVWKQRRTLDGTTYAVQKTLDAGGYLQSTTYPDGDAVGGALFACRLGREIPVGLLEG
jgi:YD repeat-containing protein